MNIRAAAAVAIAAALFLSACGAQPSNLPTATPAGAAPATNTDVPVATPAPQPDGTAASGERPYAALPPEQRAAIGDAPPPMTIDPTKTYFATISTSKGEIVVALNAEAAPQTVNNFVYLAQNGFYDGLTFHRVEPGFVIQGGDPLGNGTGGPGYNIPPEIKLPHIDGAIAMARQGGDPATTPSSGSQFYITMGAQPNLDNAYTVFGNTVRGQDVVTQIAVGDSIERIVITAQDGSAVAAAPPQPTPVPEPAACSPYLLNVAADEHILGNPNAAVTIIEYGDFQCPGCASISPALKTTMAAVSDTVRLVFRHFPLSQIHDKAIITSRAAEAAAIQGKFWEMHDLLYEKQQEWDATPVAEITATLKTFAEQLQLDAAKFEQDLDSDAVAARVQRDVDSAMALNIGGTPSFFVEGRPAPIEAFSQPDTAQQLRTFAEARAKEIAGLGTKSFSFSGPEQVTKPDAKYVMTVKTTKGDVVAELDPALAPTNVNSTVFLAQQGYFDGAPVALNDEQLGAVLMGTPTAAGNPGYQCEIEAKPGAMTQPGVVALFNGSDTAASAQFILTYSPTQELDGRFSVLGQITSGLDVVKSLAAAQGDAQADAIVSVTVEEKP